MKFSRRIIKIATNALEGFLQALVKRLDPHQSRGQVSTNKTKYNTTGTPENQGYETEISFRYLIVAVAAVVAVVSITFVVAGALLLWSLAVADAEGIARLKHIIEVALGYTVKMAGLIFTGFGGWKVFRRLIPSKDQKDSTKTRSPKRHLMVPRLATGDEDTDREVMQHVLFDALLNLGSDVVQTAKGSLVTFRRNDKVFLRVQVFETVEQLKIYGSLNVSPLAPASLANVEGLEISPRNNWGNLVLTIRKRADIHRFHSWLERCYQQAGEE